MFTPLEIKSTKRWLAWAQVPHGVAFAGIGITYLTGFFLLLKASSFQIGLIAAIPSLCCVASVLGAYLLVRYRHPKKWVVGLLFVFYASHALLGAIPFLFRQSSEAAQVLLCLFLMAVAYAAIKMQDTVWFLWVSGIVPDGQRGNFIGRLMIIGTALGMPASYLVGRYIDTARTPQGFLIVFGCSALVGFMALTLYFKLPDRGGEASRTMDFQLSNLMIPWKDPGYRKFILFASAYVFAIGLCGPFTTVFMLETLRISFTAIAIFGILASVSYILAAVIWGYLVDKYGSRPVMLLCSAPLSLLAFMWIFNTPEQYYLIPVVHVGAGIATAGLLGALENQLMGVSTDKHSAAYLATYQVTTGVVGFLAPLIGSAIVLLSRDFNVVCFGYPIGKYHVLFAITGLVSVLPLFFIRQLKEPGGKPAMVILRNLVMVNPIKLALNLFAFNRSFSEKDRLNATVALGRLGSPIVIGELINLLDDPIYFVRREAALAMGRIRDQDAVEPLLAKLSDENANIQYEAAWALGNIRHESSIAPLLECLRHSDPKLRGYAAMALGEIGSSAAIEAILKQLESSHDVFETTCAASALSRLGYKPALWKILEKLVASDQPVVRRQLSVSVGDLLGEQGRFYRLLTREERVYGEELRRMATRLRRSVEKHWKNKLGEDAVRSILESVRQIEKLYEERRYPEVLRETVVLCDRLFGPEIHRYNEMQAGGRKFLHEILTQNEALGNRVYWEEALVSVYTLWLIFDATEI
ncbi:MAG: MFS transporter [Verrucomicrobiae bacterium]|nr:MFS transporter [Verrucomicrobiae bacterium]